MNFNPYSLLGLEYNVAVKKAEDNGLNVRVELLGKDRTDTNRTEENDTHKFIRRVVRVQTTPEIVLGVSDFIHM